MVHERFDIARWIQFFPLNQLREERRNFVDALRLKEPERYPDETAFQDHVKLMRPGGEIVTGPYHMAVVEQIRQETLGDKQLITVPTDIFVFAEGEPRDRSITKVGGLPFWPEDQPWPVSESGTPLDFVAQFCFADSLDLVGPLPGDLLLVFADGVFGKDWRPDNSAALSFKWVNRSECNPIKVDSVPKTRWELSAFYGEVYRTVDYVGVGELLDHIYKQSWLIEVIQGTKIGGSPGWIQRPEKIPGRFLCALGSVHPTKQLGVKMEGLHPFTNRLEPFPPRDRRKLLMWEDVGSLFLFLGDNGEINWTIQSY